MAGVAVTALTSMSEVEVGAETSALKVPLQVVHQWPDRISRCVVDAGDFNPDGVPADNGPDGDWAKVLGGDAHREAVFSWCGLFQVDQWAAELVHKLLANVTGGCCGG